MRISKQLLTRLIKEEKAKLEEEKKKEKSVEDVAKDTEEVEAGDLADTLEKKVDFMKVLNIKEAKALKYLKKIREVKAKLSIKK